MTTFRQIKNNSRNEILIEQAKWCTTFFSKLRGFMFRRSIERDEALVFVYKKDNRVHTSIHMFFVPFDLGVVWVNEAGDVVDTVIAKPWRPQYSPSQPASFVIELHPNKLDLVKIGDKLLFNPLKPKQ